MKKYFLAIILIISASLFFSPYPGEIKAADTKDLFDLAYSLMEKRDYPGALEYYEKAIALSPKSQEIWMEYTVCLRKLKKFQRAAMAGWRALELGPQKEAIWGNIGNVFLDCHEWDAAFKAFKKAESLSKNKNWIVQNYLNLGFMQWSFDKPELALTTFNYAYALDKNNSLTLVDIGIVYASTGRIKEGIKEIEKAIKMLKNEKNSNVVKYGKRALAAIKKDNGIKPPPNTGASYQSLPTHLLTQPAPNKALKLSIAPEVKRLYVINGAKNLIITTPEPWIEGITNTGSIGLFDIIFYSIKINEKSKYMISPVKGEKELSTANLKVLVNNHGRSMLKQSVENKLKIIPITGKTITGNYYTLQDKSYKKNKKVTGEFPFLTQGVVKSGKFLFTFTILTHSRNDKYINSMLNIIRSIEFR